MSKTLYSWYRNLRNTIRDYESKKDSDVNENTIDSLLNFLSSIENDHPEVKMRYENDFFIQASFSGPQVNFICEQIGEWYLEWKDKLVDNELGLITHRLGFAKEELKSMICGDLDELYYRNIEDKRG